MVKLGKLKEVELRELWKGEATEFTPWLAKEENIALLSDEINIELEVLEQEKNVGPYRADILCKDNSNDHYVLIENQLEKTNHNHLGQLLTYASGLDAVTVIWIAKRFTEEHRAVLDWLNRITEEGINFFGIEITAYKIGESLPAPKFNIISKPNDWAKIVRGSSSNKNHSATKLLQRDYWQSLKNYLEENNSFLKCRNPHPKHWYNFAIGKSRYRVTAIANTKDNLIRVEFVSSSPNAKSNFSYLKNKYEKAFQELIDEPIIWDELPHAQRTTVYTIRKCDVHDQSDWENQFKWLKSTLEKFSKFFKPKLKELD